MKAKQVTDTVKKYNLIKEEMAILEPLWKKRNDVDKSIQEFVAKKVIPRLGLEDNIPWKTRFSIPGQWIKVKRVVHHQEITTNPESVKNVLGWGK